MGGAESKDSCAHAQYILITFFLQKLLQPLVFLFQSKEAYLMQNCVNFHHLILVVAVATSAQIAKANLDLDEKQTILDLFNYLRASQFRHQLVRGLQKNAEVIVYLFSSYGTLTWHLKPRRQPWNVIHRKVLLELTFISPPTHSQGA